MRRHFDRTLASFRDCLFTDAPLELTAAATWSDDAWFLDQDARRIERNDGWAVLQGGTGSGRLIGGNLCTLNLLQGTPYWPSLAGSVLFVEDDLESQPHHFERNLHSLLQQPDAAAIGGLVIGRFQRASSMTRGMLESIVSAAPQLAGRPVIAGVDFGHTDPVLTLPIGGDVRVEADTTTGAARIRIDRH